MTKETAHHHRSSLKQKNKPFKGGSKSRSKSRGRIALTKQKSSSSSSHLNRQDRRNQHAQILQNKRQVLIQQRRLFSGRDGMPRLVVVMPVTQSARLDSHLCLNWTDVTFSERNKQNIHFLPCYRDDLDREEEDWAKRVIEATQIADCICFVASGQDEEFDSFGRLALTIIRAMGISSSAILLSDIDDNKSNSKSITTLKRFWSDRFTGEGISKSKIYLSNTFSNAESLERIEFERILCQQQLKGISWRNVRPYMVTDTIEVLSTPGATPMVKATGFIRGGKPFSANRLIHIPALGANFIINRVELASSLSPRSSGQNTISDMQVDKMVQIRDQVEAETLESERPIDPFSENALHQTGLDLIYDADNHDDFECNDEDLDAKKRLVKVPKGTCSYHAIWYEGEQQDGDANAGEYEEVIIDENEPSNEIIDGMELDSADHDAKYQEHQELQRNHRHFPDEVALDPRCSTKSRLQRYRGVQSLRTSQWHSKENLPFDYGRIFCLANYKHSRKVALEENDSPFVVGQRVALYIEGISEEIIRTHLNQQLTIFGLLKHEQKQSVLSFTFNRSKEFEGELRNKEELVAVIGPRKFIINPIFSEHTSLPLHKMLRIVDENLGMVVATIFAPIIFTPCPVLLFRRNRLGDSSLMMELVGTGSVLECNPNRIILKRITLTGSPFRVHKRAAVVRFMFSNPTDVNWFKPVELMTKAGARGHIRESLGTHGYMKCLFDRTIFHHDTVAMHLYKRVFPKWTTRSYC